jgi:hypothetical protein
MPIRAGPVSTEHRYRKTRRAGGGRRRLSIPVKPEKHQMIVTPRGQAAELGEPGLKVDCRPVWKVRHAKQLSYIGRGSPGSGPARPRMARISACIGRQIRNGSPRRRAPSTEVVAGRLRSRRWSNFGARCRKAKRTRRIAAFQRFSSFGELSSRSDWASPCRPGANAGGSRAAGPSNQPAGRALSTGGRANRRTTRPGESARPGGTAAARAAGPSRRSSRGAPR